MPSPDSILASIDRQRDTMIARITRWANINSGTANAAGVARMMDELAPILGSLGAAVKRVELPPFRRLDPDGQWREAPVGPLLQARKRPEAGRQVLLVIHADTVYPANHPFQRTHTIDDHTLGGPGVADAKGGLAVMMAALEAFESSPDAAALGWEVVINPDEEIGSPCSHPTLVEAAKRNHLGMVYEPCFYDGMLVGRRKGSGNFTLIVRGRAAHAGRDFTAGRNAVHYMAALIAELASWNDRPERVTVNVGRVEGGGAPNVVPDLAFCRFNIRVAEPADMTAMHRKLAELFDPARSPEGFSLEWTGSFTSPPKMIDAPTQLLMDALADCGRQIGLEVRYRDSGGVSDGNRLAAAGLPVVDTLGPAGDGLHSDRERVALDTLTQRAKLSALLLMELAGGKFPELFKDRRS